MKKNLYVSLPITGRPIDEAKKEAELVRKRWQSEYLEIITPFDICRENEDYEKCMGRDIEALLRCDGIILCKGWKESKGCNAEYAVALIYDKKVYNETDKVSSK